jgi:hypothetical protein
MDNSRNDWTVLVRDTQYHISREKVVVGYYCLLGLMLWSLKSCRDLLLWYSGQRVSLKQWYIYYQTVQCHISEDGNLHSQHHKSITSLKVIPVLSFKLFDWKRFRNARHTKMQWNFCMTKPWRWQNYVCNNEILLHWNVLRFERDSNIPKKKQRSRQTTCLHWNARDIAACWKLL